MFRWFKNFSAWIAFNQVFFHKKNQALNRNSFLHAPRQDVLVIFTIIFYWTLLHIWGRSAWFPASLAPRTRSCQTLLREFTIEMRPKPVHATISYKHFLVLWCTRFPSSRLRTRMIIFTSHKQQFKQVLSQIAFHPTA